MKRLKNLLLFGLFTLLVFLISTVGIAAQQSSADSVNGRWVTKKNSCSYIYESGKKAKGIVTIGNKRYYFDEKGVQRTGWRKVNGGYYFFVQKNGEKGYMRKNKTINGIKLRKNGRALLTGYAKEKLNVFMKAQAILDSCTKPTWSKEAKLKACWQYTLNNFKYHGDPIFHLWTNWEFKYALQMFDGRSGSCYAYGAAFAFLASVCGYSDCYAVSSGGHGWANIGGLFYDPSWQLVDGHRNNYFGVTRSQCGRNGVPRYATEEYYRQKI